MVQTDKPYKKLKSWKSVVQIGKPITRTNDDNVTTDYYIPMNYHGLNYPKVSNEVEEYYDNERRYKISVKKNEGTIILVG